MSGSDTLQAIVDRKNMPRKQFSLLSRIAFTEYDTDDIVPELTVAGLSTMPESEDECRRLIKELIDLSMIQVLDEAAIEHIEKLISRDAPCELLHPIRGLGSYDLTLSGASLYSEIIAEWLERLPTDFTVITTVSGTPYEKTVIANTSNGALAAVLKSIYGPFHLRNVVNRKWERVEWAKIEGVAEIGKCRDYWWREPQTGFRVQAQYVLRKTRDGRSRSA